MEHNHEVIEEKTEFENETVSELGTFKPKEADYQVWALSYDKNDEFIKEKLIQSFAEPGPAIDFAQAFCTKLCEADKSKLDSRIAYINVLVETVVQIEEDYDENIGTLFDEHVIVKDSE